MDSRDSSRENNQPTEGSGAAAAEDDGVLNGTYALAKDAAVLFQSHKYSECLDVLNQLLLKKPNDPKILHNIAITNFYHNGCSDPKKLLEQLDNVKRRSEDLACASVESANADGNMGDKANSVSKGTHVAANQSPAETTETIVYTDEFDTSVALLNIATIWFHLHEYSKALTVLEPLYLNIEPLDEKTARRICLLLLDVALASRDALRSADVLSYLETASNVHSSTNLGDTGNTGQQQSFNLETKSISLPSSADGPISESTAGINVSDNTLSRTLSEETDFENLFSTLDIGGDNQQGSGGLSSSNDLSRMPADHCISAIDHRLNLQLNKIRFLLLTRNVKSMKREVKEAMNLARGGDSTMALLLKSQFEYARGNHRKAIKLLIASNNRNENVFSSICNNNFGCIYYQLGKYHTSSLLLSRALSNTCSLKKDNCRSLLTFSQDKSFMIVYNCGLQYLACGKPILAARCFQKASLVFYNRPILWLRISECCLMAVEKGLLKTSGASTYGSEVKALVIGKGKWRHLVLENGFLRSHVNSVGDDNSSFSDDKQLTLSLSLARQCLLNALHLLNDSNMDGFLSDSNLEENLDGAAVEDTNHRSSDSKMANVTANSGQVATNGELREQRGGQSQSDLIKTSLAEYEQICKRENLEIKQALLANLAYVELELQNPLKALSTAKSLLKLEECNRIYIFLGHVYAAEALCRLDRPKEAAEHLSAYLSGESNFELPYREEDCEKWKIEKLVDEDANGTPGTAKSARDAQNNLFMTPEKAREALYVNLAVTCAVQGDHEQAHKFATQALSTVPNSCEAILTVVYVDLMLGKTQEALAKLKSCNRVTFLPFHP